MTNTKRYLAAVVLGCLLGGIVYAIVFPKKSSQGENSAGSPPEVLSCVKHIKVISRRIDAQSAQLMVEVENTSDVGIVAISLEAKKGKDTYTVRTSTFEADEPLIIIKPHERHQLNMALSNIMPKAHLQIGSVVYADGTEDGCEASVRATRKAKTYHEQLKAQKKASK
jgi:hypothetical protein